MAQCTRTFCVEVGFVDIDKNLVYFTATEAGIVVVVTYIRTPAQCCYKRNSSTMSAINELCGFRHPAPIVFAGPTGCGKTMFLHEVLNKCLIHPPPQRIIWVYDEWQPIYDKVLISAPNVEFIKFGDEISIDNLYDLLNPKTRNLVVLDDQMSKKEVRDSLGLAKLFTQGSHHRNTTVVYIVQNIFDQGGAMRTASLNSHYIVLFKNPRDKGQVQALAQQMYPTNKNFFIRAFENATREPYNPLIIDLKQDTPEELRLRTNMFDPSPIVYLQQKSI